MTTEVRVLGAVDVRIDGLPVDTGHARQQCVLTALALAVGRPIPLEQLADRVWGEHRPQRAHDTMLSYLSRLRRVFAPAGDADIVRRCGGYVLDIDPLAVDLCRFRHLLVAARRCVDDFGAADLYARALALWRGEAFGYLDTPWLNTMRETLHAERLAVELDRNDAALRLGRHGELVGQVCAAATDNPWDERLAAQLMLALYRCGRQSEALGCYEDLRRRLADALGADPTPPLRLLHQRILHADPSLTAHR